MLRSDWMLGSIKVRLAGRSVSSHRRMCGARCFCWFRDMRHAPLRRSVSLEYSQHFPDRLVVLRLGMTTKSAARLAGTKEFWPLTLLFTEVQTDFRTSSSYLVLIQRSSSNMPRFAILRPTRCLVFCPEIYRIPPNRWYRLRRLASSGFGRAFHRSRFRTYL
jgi:hypothetical protein